MNDFFFGGGHKIVNLCALKIYQNLNVKSQVTTEGRYGGKKSMILCTQSSSLTCTVYDNLYISCLLNKKLLANDIYKLLKRF